MMRQGTTHQEDAAEAVRERSTRDTTRPANHMCDEPHARHTTDSGDCR